MSNAVRLLIQKKGKKKKKNTKAMRIKEENK